ncbi:MAG: hypothetical protein ABI415_09980, partial [Flavitalea sp.]
KHFTHCSISWDLVDQKALAGFESLRHKKNKKITKANTFENPPYLLKIPAFYPGSNMLNAEVSHAGNMCFEFIFYDADIAGEPVFQAIEL